MRWIRGIGGTVLLLAGIVWLLQGLRILPGSYMSGSAFWGTVGAVLTAVGIWLLLGLRQRRA